MALALCFIQLLIVLVSVRTETLDYLVKVSACDSEVYCKGPLLSTVQQSRLFNDSKTFVDMTLKDSPGAVLTAFRNLNDTSREAIKAFVEQFFDGPGTEFENWIPDDWVESPAFLGKIKDQDLKKWASAINKLWKRLGRKIRDDVKTNPERYSLIYLPNPFIVPGGRFREVYYWDSYWVINGLLLSEMYSTVKGMISNFLTFVETLGFVPNGGRVYYTRRSQPPLLIPMVGEYYRTTNDTDFLKRSLPTLEKEYEFWLNNRTVEISSGNNTYKLARYAVEIGQPRPESLREDEETAKDASNKSRLYSNIASAAESGWDFSTRWFSPGNLSLATITTRDIVPVDLNAILCWNEKLLSQFYSVIGDAAKSNMYQLKSEERRKAIRDILWNDVEGIWHDFNVASSESNNEFYASSIAPLWTGCHGDSTNNKSEIERKVLDYLKRKDVLNYPGGIPTSDTSSRQQWDFPNAWPPLQQMYIWALDSSSIPEMRRHGKNLAEKWTFTTWKSWEKYGHMYEKYDATMVGARGGGGEYDVQLGFGWTNGVALQILNKYGDTLSANIDHGTTTSSTPTHILNSADSSLLVEVGVKILRYGFLVLFLVIYC